jgi:hypothetical protein
MGRRPEWGLPVAIPPVPPRVHELWIGADELAYALFIEVRHADDLSHELLVLPRVPGPEDGS